MLLQQLNDQKSPPILIPGALPIPHKIQAPPTSAYIVPQVTYYRCHAMVLNRIVYTFGTWWDLDCAL